MNESNQRTNQISALSDSLAFAKLHPEKSSVTEVTKLIEQLIALADTQNGYDYAVARALIPTLGLGIALNSPPMLELGLAAEVIRGDEMTKSDDAYSWEQVLECYDQLSRITSASNATDPEQR